MNTQKLIVGIVLPLIAVGTYIFLSYVAWGEVDSHIQSQTQVNVSFCDQTSEYVKTFGMERCRRFAESNISEVNAYGNIEKIFFVGATGLVLILSIILSFLSFRQDQNTALDKKTTRLFAAVFICFAFLLSANVLASGFSSISIKPVAAGPIVVLTLLGVLLSVAVAWGYTVYYFVASIREKNARNIILSLVIGTLVSYPILHLLDPLIP